MSTFKEVRRHNEQQVIVQLLSQIESSSTINQRGLAAELDIALGLMNQYLKRCISKGWIRATKVSPRRIKYFMTPEGFAEKSRMVAKYLNRSLVFFKNARIQCEDVYASCQKLGWLKVGLYGTGDLADIAKLVAGDTKLEVTIVKNPDELEIFDAILITNISNPQLAYKTVQERIENKRIFTLPLSHISKVKTGDEVAK